MTSTLFDHLNAIYENQSLDYFDSLDEDSKKTYSGYMVNRLLSMNADYIPVINVFQEYLNTVSPRESYLFFAGFIPRGRQYNGYIKSKAAKDHELWVIDLVAQHFDVSRQDAREYLVLFYKTDHGKADLKQIMESHGIDPKQIKKAKL